MKNITNHVTETVSKNLQETYYEISRQAEELLDAEFSTIFLEESGELKRVYASNLTLASSDLRKNGRTYKSFKNGDIHISSINSVKDINPLQLKLNVKTIVFIPLVLKKKKIGILNVLSRKGPRFNEKELHLINVLGSLASLSIRNAQLLEENKHLLALREIFFAAASHELKTPLTTIKLYGQLLYNALESGKKPKVEWGNVLIREVTRITRLINEFWLTDQIKSGHLTYTRKFFILHDLIDEAIMEFQSSYPHKIVFKNMLVKKSDMVYADYDRILGALTNVLNNAGKHSLPGSAITLTLKSNNDYLIIKVQDKGRGISKNDMDKIFDAFYKGGKQEGIGMGLYLAKSIIESHKGRIKIKSALHVGTEVGIYLPFYKKVKNEQARTSTT